MKKGQLNKVADQIIGSFKKALPTMVVKTASASRAGNKIQARLTWTENGKKQLGYLSTYLTKGKLAASPLPPGSVIQQTFRARERATDIVTSQPGVSVATGPDLYGNVNSIENIVISTLTQDGAVVAKLALLCHEVHQKMEKVVADGGHRTARQSRNQIRSRKSLASTLDFALNSGISDDEVRDMLKEAIVRHTMNS